MTLSVHRHTDGTFDVSYAESSVSFSVRGVSGSLVDDTASPAPVAAVPYTCPQCGAGYDGPGSCSNQHPAAAVVATTSASADTEPSPSSSESSSTTTSSLSYDQYYPSGNTPSLKAAAAPDVPAAGSVDWPAGDSKA